MSNWCDGNLSVRISNVHQTFNENTTEGNLHLWKYLESETGKSASGVQLRQSPSLCSEKTSANPC